MCPVRRSRLIGHIMVGILSVIRNIREGILSSFETFQWLCAASPRNTIVQSEALGRTKKLLNMAAIINTGITIIRTFDRILAKSMFQYSPAIDLDSALLIGICGLPPRPLLSGPKSTF